MKTASFLQFRYFEMKAEREDTGRAPDDYGPIDAPEVLPAGSTIALFEGYPCQKLVMRDGVFA